MKKVLMKKNIDIALFCNFDSESYDKNMYYFSGYKGLGCLVIPKKKPSFLLVPEMEYERARHESKVKVLKWKKGDKLFEFLRKILRKKKIRTRSIGICKDTFTLSLYKAMKKEIRGRSKDISKECIESRMIKNSKEIILLRKACKIADKILWDCIKNIRKFKTEKDVENFLHFETIKQGCELSFKPIVASGKGASMPHYEAQNIKLRKGFLVIDFGIKYKGYYSDCTRTIYLGKPSQKERQVYELLLNTQEEIIRKINLGKKCKKAYEETVSSLGKYGKYFTHGLGHGIGLQIHEFPNITPKSKDRFKNNMVFTIEPGIYIPGKFGMRIEDALLINKGKIEILTKNTKKLIIK